jgi:NAD(P)-dependent dehydrogenase (short-subunit alcohol dehydrogenase family)
MRLEGKVGIVVGAGQMPGDTIGNGRAAAVLFAREGAKVLLVDRELERAEETAAMIAAEGGQAQCLAGDWTRAADCKAYVQACAAAWGRVDFLHNKAALPVMREQASGTIEVLQGRERPRRLEPLRAARC